MKRITVILALLAATFAGTLYAQEKQPVLAFDQTEHDFGRMAEKGGKQAFDFVFVNTGSVPAVIIDVTVSCKCTKIVYPKKPVAPGARAMINVTYDPKGQKGVFYKAIQVMSSTPDKRQILTIRGEVF